MGRGIQMERTTTVEMTLRLVDQAMIKDACVKEAQKSDCKKARFGAALFVQRLNPLGVQENVVLYSAHNHLEEPYGVMCADECIRLNIPSRTDSMLGGCLHAEEQLAWRFAKMQAHRLKAVWGIFVLKIDEDDQPILYTDRQEFSCIRCAHQMYQSGIDNVGILTPNGWKLIPPKDALRQSIEYAMGNRHTNV